LVLLSVVAGFSIYLPTTYAIVVLLAFISGVHYIFQVAWLMREEDKQKVR
jgi:hypothetical protein